MPTSLRVLAVAAVLFALVSCSPAASVHRGAEDGTPDRLRDVLVFLKPAWYRHASLDSLAHWFQHFGWDHGINVDTTDHPEIFNLDDLARYDAVVFVSTTDLGNALNDGQKSALAKWYQQGHGIVALHAAAVHHSTWDWWARLVGCDFNSDSVRARARVIVPPEASEHPAVKGQGPEFWIEEEWLCYDRSVSGIPGMRVLLRLDESTYEPVRAKFQGNGGKPMGKDHPAAWCREVDGGRFFYTALGHDVRALSTPFGRQHLLGGLSWVTQTSPAKTFAEGPASPGGVLH